MHGEGPAARLARALDAATDRLWAVPLGCGVILIGIGVAGVTAASTAVAVVLEGVFVAFFLRHLSFTLAALRSAGTDLDAPIGETDFKPPVSVLVACKDEERVVEGLVASLLALDYPAELMQIVIVDDGSSDRTPDLLREMSSREPRLTFLHRPPGLTGGKSAALNEALGLLSGEITLVFDADHQPRRDVARRLVRHFEDPSVAAAQGRCVISNGGESAVAKLVELDYRAGYLVNEYGRQALFQLPAYGGANCAVRTESLRQLGGWNHDSVTEDTDLTLRLLLSGRRVRYDVTAVDEEQGVGSLRRYWRQRYRWARGHQQVCRRYRRAVWRSPFLGRLAKVETTMFLFAFHLPVLAGAGMILLLGWATGVAGSTDPLHTFVLWTLLFVGPLAELSGGLIVARSDRRDALKLVFFLPLFLLSIMLCTKAWMDALLARPYAWVKTERSAPAPVLP